MQASASAELESFQTKLAIRSPNFKLQAHSWVVLADWDRRGVGTIARRQSSLECCRCACVSDKSKNVNPMLIIEP